MAVSGEILKQELNALFVPFHGTQSKQGNAAEWGQSSAILSFWGLAYLRCQLSRLSQCNHILLDYFLLGASIAESLLPSSAEEIGRCGGRTILMSADGATRMDIPQASGNRRPFWIECQRREIVTVSRDLCQKMARDVWGQLTSTNKCSVIVTFFKRPKKS